MSRYDDHYDYRYRDRERDRDRDRDRDYRDYRDSRGSRRDFRGGGAIDESRIYVGGLSSRTRESDLYDFFYNYYPKRVDMKQGYGFVEFESRRDADDAVRDLDGVRLDDARITVQFARARRSERAMPHRPRGYRIEVTGLDPRTSWQSLKDFSRDAGEVIFTDVFNSGSKHHGIIEYANYDSMKRALKELDGKKLDGASLLLNEAKDNPVPDQKSNGRGRGRSRSPLRRHSPSPRSPTRRQSPSPRSPIRQRSPSPRSPIRQRSPSPRSPTRQRSPSPRSPIRQHSPDRSPSRSRSPHRFDRSAS